MKKVTLVFVFITGYVSCAMVRNGLTYTVNARFNACFNEASVKQMQKRNDNLFFEEVEACAPKSRFNTLEKTIGLIIKLEEK